MAVLAYVWALALFLLIGTIQGQFTCAPSSQYAAKTTALGCYTDSNSRTLNGRTRNSQTNTPQECATFCGQHGYAYSGVEFSLECYCGDNISSMATQQNNSSCNDQCTGDSSQQCGGFFAINVYKISNPNAAAAAADHVFQRQPVCQTYPFCQQKACDTSMSIANRVSALISAMTLPEKINNTGSTSTGAPRIGLPAYEWWNEALHGVALSNPGVSFNLPNGSAFSYATSFPLPILMGAAFDDVLIRNVAATIGIEARAFANAMQAGLDFYTPNINAFLDPRWGRGQEVPTEDPFRVQGYIKSLLPGLQGTNPASKQLIATCKHYAVYDVETNRLGQNYNPTQQDLGEYYLPAFKTCVRDAGAGSVMCSYNAVDGVPSCASEYLLQTVLRDAYGFGSDPYRYITADCDAVDNVFANHGFVDGLPQAAAVSLNAGTDLDCGSPVSRYQMFLGNAISSGFTTEANVDRALTRLYTALFTVGYFDGQPAYTNLGWSNVSTGAAQSLAYQAAWEGMTLLKNNGVLPLKSSLARGTVALIGPMANATDQLKGNYFGMAPYLISPLQAAQAQFGSVKYAMGTQINTADTSGFADALSAARSSDVIIYMGGIDNSIEAEGKDRTSLSWPGNQLDLLSQLGQLGKPLITVQFGGGQLDDSALLAAHNLSALLWAGYPGQDGGYAVIDTLLGKKSPAGRLPITQYPAAYANQVSVFNPNLRPNGSYPGRTYKWYNQTPVLPFGFGLHYTSFKSSWQSSVAGSHAISSLVPSGANDATPLVTVQVAIANTGSVTSDYVGLLFIRTRNAGPPPYPNKALVSYARLHDIAPGSSQTMSLSLNFGAIAQADTNGDLVIYPGDYELSFDVDDQLKMNFTLTGSPVLLETLPRMAASYNYTVPVHPQS